MQPKINLEKKDRGPKIGEYLSMYYLIVIILVIIIIGFFYFGKKPKIHKINSIRELPKFIDGFDQTTPGTILIVTHKKTKKFIQMIKDCDESSGEYFVFSFPYAVWSRDYFEKLLISLSDNNISYDIVKTNDENVTKFVDVNFIKDKNKLYEIARIAIDSIDLKEEDVYTVHYKGWLKKKR
jgi:hypothetical protein